MSNQPAHMPPDFESALGYLMGVRKPSIDDLKLMAYLEAGGEAFYLGLAESAPSAEIKELFVKTGREERAHAHRCKRVIEKLTGESFTVPAPADNPYYVIPEGLVCDEAMINGLIEGEEGGGALYEGWANGIGDADCADLLRQNGQEEISHSERARKALTLING